MRSGSFATTKKLGDFPELFYLFNIAFLLFAVAAIIHVSRILVSNDPTIVLKADGFIHKRGALIPWSEVSMIERYTIQSKGVRTGIGIRLDDASTFRTRPKKLPPKFLRAKEEEYDFVVDSKMSQLPLRQLEVCIEEFRKEFEDRNLDVSDE